MKASITVQDVAGSVTAMRLNGLNPALSEPETALSTFIDTLQPFVNGGLTDYFVLKPDVDSVDKAAVNAEYSSGLHKALITVGFKVADEDHYTNLWLPAPHLANGFELISGVGYRIKSAAADEILAALNTASNETFTFSRGVLEYKKGRSGKPSTGAYLKMKDFMGRTQYMGVPAVTDKAKLKTFAEFLCDNDGDRYTTCGCSEVCVLGKVGGRKSPTPGADPGFDHISHRATLRFTWEKSNKLHTMVMSVPTLKSSSLDSAGGGARQRTVKEATGDAIADALTTLYGSSNRTLVFAGGVCDVENPQV